MVWLAPASGTDRPAALVLPDPGDADPAMAAELYRTVPVFRAAFDRCREPLAGRGVDPLSAVLAGAGGVASAAVPTVRFGRRVEAPGEEAGRSFLLDTQIQIAAGRRRFAFRQRPARPVHRRARVRAAERMPTDRLEDVRALDRVARTVQQRERLLPPGPPGRRPTARAARDRRPSGR